MDRQCLKNQLLKLYFYFRIKDLPTTEQIDLWHENLKYIPQEATDDIFKILTENDNLPRNIPKAIRKAYIICKSQYKFTKSYDRENDPTYPIHYLYCALEILESKGDDEFIQYCRDVKMPLQDIDKVRNKFNAIFETEKIRRLDDFRQ